ncbi:MAG: glycosyltransferase family 4 protein [Phycisphaerae bacterium]
MSNANLTSRPVAEPLHVLHLVPRDAHARFGRMFRQLGLALEEEGFRVSLASDDPRLIADVETSPIAGVAVRAFTGWRALGLLAEIDRVIEQPADFLHAWGLSALPAARRIALRSPRPILVHLTTMDELDLLARRPLKQGEYVAVACRRQAAWLRQRRAASPMPSVIEPGLLAPDELPPREIESRTLGILWLARPTTLVAMQLLLDFVAALRKENAETQTVVALDGAAAGRLWRTARERSLHDCITILEDSLLWNQALRGFDVCIVPSNQTELSLAPLLAMSLGEIVIAAREQLADWFSADETIMTYATGDALDLARQVQRVIERQPACAALSRSAIQYVRERHSLSSMATRLIELYSTLVADWRRLAARSEVRV